MSFVDEMSLATEKAIVLVGMFVATMCFGLIPIKLVMWTNNSNQDESSSQESNNNNTSSRLHKRRLKTGISLANCFSGGVFVAACLLDLFPDIHESVDAVLDEIARVYHTQRIDYPVAEFIIVFGFLLVLVTEQLILEIKDYASGRANLSVMASPNAEPQENDPLINTSSYGSIQAQPAPTAPQSDPQLRQRYISGESHHSSSQHSGHDHSAVFEEHSALRSFILLTALTFHSLFEGLAIGLQQEYAQLIQIFIAVIVHKGIMAFSLGLNLAQSQGMTVKYFVASVIVFSLASPVGMGIGMAISGLPPSIARDVANGVLQGVAGGTFLYITFFEVLPHEFSSNRMRLPKVACLLLGYSAICGLLFITH